MRSIAVIDYGMGNLRSVVNALQVVTEGRDQVLLTSDPAQVLAADLPPAIACAQSTITACARRSSRQPGSSRFSGFAWACRC
jgi:imidazoleglycerol phosphate synthase glutamine amidotransferase subunit HisH